MAEPDKRPVTLEELLVSSCRRLTDWRSSWLRKGLNSASPGWVVANLP